MWEWLLRVDGDFLLDWKIIINTFSRVMVHNNSKLKDTRGYKVEKGKFQLFDHINFTNPKI